MQLLLRHPYFCTPQHVFLLWRYYDPWGIAKGMGTSSCTWNGQYLLRQTTGLGNIFFILIYFCAWPNFAFEFIFVFLALSQINDLNVSRIRTQIIGLTAWALTGKQITLLFVSRYRSAAARSTTRSSLALSSGLFVNAFQRTKPWSTSAATFSLWIWREEIFR